MVRGPDAGAYVAAHGRAYRGDNFCDSDSIMNGIGVFLLAAGIMGLALAWSALMDALARRKLRGAQSVASDQRARAQADARRLLSPHERTTWDAEAARRARRVK